MAFDLVSYLVFVKFESPIKIILSLALLLCKSECDSFVSAVFIVLS